MPNPKMRYKIVIDTTSNIEWVRFTLEGVRVSLRANSKRQKFTNMEKEIEVEGKLNIFCKCKGDTGILATCTVTNLQNNKKVLDEKKITIGQQSSSAPRIGRWSGDVTPI